MGKTVGSVGLSGGEKRTAFGELGVKPFDMWGGKKRRNFNVLRVKGGMFCQQDIWSESNGLRGVRTGLSKADLKKNKIGEGIILDSEKGNKLYPLLDRWN